MGRSPAPFIVGVERSGTTLLRVMLDAHPDLAIPYETHFLAQLSRAPEPPTSAQALLTVITGNDSWPNLALAQAELADAEEAVTPFELSDAVRAFYRLSAARRGKPRWGDKTPTHLRRMTWIQALLPEARFVHIVRDGRDVAMSLRGLWFGPGANVETAARFWAEQITSARAHAAGLRHYVELRYEDLVSDPEAELRRLGDFLELPFHLAMLDHRRTASERLGELIRPFGANGADQLDIESFRAIHERTTSPLDSSRIGRWRQEMTAEDRSRFEAIAGSVLTSLGYEIG